MILFIIIKTALPLIGINRFFLSISFIVYNRTKNIAIYNILFYLSHLIILERHIVSQCIFKFCQLTIFIVSIQ